MLEREERLSSDRAITQMNLAKMREEQERAAGLRREKLEGQEVIKNLLNPPLYATIIY
jgi:hypothetical protein